jgi:hypothetical protein
MIVTSTFTSTTGYRMKFSAIGVPQPNLVREFRGMSDSDSAECTKFQRVQAIAQRIQSAIALGEAVKNATPSATFSPSPTFETTFTSATRSASTPIDLIDYQHFKTYSVKEQVTIISAAGISSKEKVVRYLMTDVIYRNIIMTNVESEIIREMNGLKKQMQEEGLDKTSTYCKADYKKPVGVISEQIQRVKTKCPLFFNVILKTVCADSFNDNYSVALKQKNTMDTLILTDNKNRKTTTQADLIKLCFRNRIPLALTVLLQRVPELYTTTSTSSPDISTAVPTSSNSASSVSRTIRLQPTLHYFATKEERLCNVSMEYITSVAAKYTEELTMKEALATSACEIVLQMRNSGHGLTPTGVHLGLLSNLCGFTNQGQDIFSAKGITCGRSTSKTIIDGLTKEYEKDVSNKIRNEARNNKKKILVIFDNYNILRWLKRIKTDATFTMNIPSISILVKVLPCEEKEEDAGDAFVPFDFTALQVSMGESWKVDDTAENIRDNKFDEQGMFTFLPYPSINAKSSSEKDIKEIKVTGFLKGICNMGSEEVAVVVDPEIILLLGKIAHLDPEGTKNLIMMPPIFHMRKHLIENFFCDPVNLLFIVLPLYIECFGLQVAKKILQAEAVESKMKWRIVEKEKSVLLEMKREEEKKKVREGRDKRKAEIVEKKTKDRTKGEEESWLTLYQT